MADIREAVRRAFSKIRGFLSGAFFRSNVLVMIENNEMIFGLGSTYKMGGWLKCAKLLWFSEMSFSCFY